MLTKIELEAQEVFDRALVQAWDDYNRIETPALQARQDAIVEADKELRRNLNEPNRYYD